MKISQKIISGFLMVGLLILVVSYISVVTQEDLSTKYRKVVGEVLPGTIEAQKIEATLYHCEYHTVKYGLTGNIEHKKMAEDMLADLEEHVATHRLYHAGLDDPKVIHIIDEEVETFTSFIAEYILLKDKGGSKEQLDIVGVKIHQAIHNFISSVGPYGRQHLEDAEETIKTVKQQTVQTRKLILVSNAIVLTLAVLWGLFVSRLISAPIKKLTKAAAQIGKGHLDTNIEIKSKDEIGELAISFSKMAQDLKSITVSRDELAKEVVERTKAETALRDSEERMRAILEASPDMIFQVDTDFRIIWANKLCRDFNPKAVGSFCHKEYQGKDEICEGCPCYKALKTNQTSISVMYHPAMEGVQGESYWENIGVPLRDDQGNAIGAIEIARDVTERMQSEKALRQSEEKLAGIVNSVIDHMIMVDEQFNIVWANDVAKEFFGPDLVGMKCYSVYHGHDEACKPCIVKECFEDGKAHEFETEINTPKGDKRFARCTASVSAWSEDKRPEMVVEFLRDITERKRTEEQIEASLREKEVLLQEIHHRVKNNLQVISSLLNLQSRYIKEDMYADMFMESQNRILSMALIHEELYQSKDLARIDLNDYIRHLTNALFRSYGVDTSRIVLTIDIADLVLGIGTAIPCGLIINELVFNALKYAFPKDNKGEIKIAFRSFDENEVELIVSDNGVGLPKDLDLTNPESMGLRLIRIMTEQIDGKIELDRNDGTKFQIRFKKMIG
jgi:PAS domain S-box-containing protein